MDDDIRWATNRGVRIAYRTVGEGPIDLLIVPTWASNLDILDEYGPVLEWRERLTGFARVIVMDRRGSGLSDRLCGTATLEEGIDDALAVLDAAGSEKAALFGLNESGALCALLAATHPDRVASLILYGSFATSTWKPDYPWGTKPDERIMQVKFMVENWGEDAAFILNPQAASDPQFLGWAKRFQRNAISRDALEGAFETLAHTDVRHVLASIRVPTLVLHRADDMVVPVDNGRYLAERIPGAKYVELTGRDHVPFLGDWQALVDEIEDFLTGGRRPRAEERVLATILFVDIVGSTHRASELGDARWREVLGEYERILAAHLDRHRGKLIKSLGDGHLATFDGPARAIRCAWQLRQVAKRVGLEVRAGLHTGEVDKNGDDVSGIAVHIGARVASLAAAGEVLVSGSIPPLVAGSGIDFDDRGEHDLKGAPTPWRILAVSSC